MEEKKEPTGLIKHNIDRHKYQYAMWQKGPYVDEYGILVIPLHPAVRTNLEYWTGFLGFRYNYDMHQLVRSVDKLHNGKRYSAESWLRSAKRHFQSWYATIEQHIGKPLGELKMTGTVAPRKDDKIERAQGLYALFRGCWSTSEALDLGYKFYQYAGAVKNEFAITDQEERRELQRLASKEWRLMELMTPVGEKVP